MLCCCSNYQVLSLFRYFEWKPATFEKQTPHFWVDGREEWCGLFFLSVSTILSLIVALWSLRSSYFTQWFVSQLIFVIMRSPTWLPWLVLVVANQMFSSQPNRTQVVRLTSIGFGNQTYQTHQMIFKSETNITTLHKNKSYTTLYPVN